MKLYQWFTIYWPIRYSVHWKDNRCIHLLSVNLGKLTEFSVGHLNFAENLVHCPPPLVGLKLKILKFKIHRNKVTAQNTTNFYRLIFPTNFHKLHNIWFLMGLYCTLFTHQIYRNGHKTKRAKSKINDK